MSLIKRNKQQHNLSALVDEIKITTDANRYTTLFIELIAVLRPGRKGHAVDSMQSLLDVMNKDKQFVIGLQSLFLHLFNTKDSQSVLTDVGILHSGTIFSEMYRYIRHKIIPPLPDKRSFKHLLERAFFKNSDYKWVAEIPNHMWKAFFNAVSSGMTGKTNSLTQYLLNSLTILSFRVSYLGLEDELSQQLKNQSELITPFLEQNTKIQLFIQLIKTEQINNSKNEIAIRKSAEDCFVIIEECIEIIEKIKNNTTQYGTSLGQSYLLLRTSQQLFRIKILLTYLIPGEFQENIINTSVELFKSIIESINKRYSVIDLYSKNSGMLAYQVAEHKSASGEHYITTTRPEYIKFFYAAAAGGVIIAFAALIKALLHKVTMAPFWQYFFYSLNYSIAFVTLFITGASLATKQPTMTASALAGSLDSRKGTASLHNLAITFGKVWRSQFASFGGNLIVVFPLAYLLSFGWTVATGTLLLDTEEESLKALRDQNPLTSLAWVYACITGVFLFLSGIISGIVDNKVTYANIRSRLKEHPKLKRWMKTDTLNKFSDYIYKNLGGIIGNISLGFMLGYAQLIGSFFGIPFDIRHITISTAYYAFGVDGLANNLSKFDWIWTSIGVIGIGFFNFAISFSLAFYVAVRSRNVPLNQFAYLGKLIWIYFKKHPKDFIFPPKVERTEENVFGNTKDN
jgi:site-specific recombinase